MMSLKLWRAMHNTPTTQPLIERILLEPTLPRRKRNWTGYAMLALLSLVFVWIIVAAGILAVIVIILIAFIYIAHLFLSLAGVIFGKQCAAELNAIVAQERAGRRYDLLALMPNGRLGLMWVVGVSLLHYRKRHQRRTRSYIGSAIIVLLTWFYFAAMVADESNEPFVVIMLLGSVCVLVFVFYFEYIQSHIAGFALGVLVSTLHLQPRESRALAGLGFLVIKVCLAGFATVFSVAVCVPLLSRLTVFSLDVVFIAVATIMILTFFGLQELFVIIAWRGAMHRMGVSLSDQQAIIWSAA